MDHIYQPTIALPLHLDSVLVHLDSEDLRLSVYLDWFPLMWTLDSVHLPPTQGDMTTTASSVPCPVKIWASREQRFIVR